MNGKLITDYRLLLTVYCLLLLGSLAFTLRDYFVRYANHPQLVADFYLPDWELGQFAAEQPEGTAVYLTPTQEEMATIYFAMAAPDGIRSYSGTGALVPTGAPGSDSLYLVRPDSSFAWQQLTAFFDDYEVDQSRTDYWVLRVPDSASQAMGAAVDDETAVSFADQVQLRGWSSKTEVGQVQVNLVWQAQADMPLAYTAYVHVIDSSGQIVAQLDRQPDGYPTTDWQPGEVVVDTYTMELPGDAAGPFTLETGFYDLDTLAGLGETAVLTESFTP